VNTPINRKWKVHTGWRRQRESQVKTKESMQSKGTHSLKNRDEGICQESKGKYVSKGHSHSKKCRVWDKLGTANISE
jgi:poly-D-alanine transfer protein DltD